MEEVNQGALSTYHFGVILADGDCPEHIQITLKGHKVAANSGYTGSLLCTGLTHWCNIFLLFFCKCAFGAPRPRRVIEIWTLFLTAGE